MIAISYRREDSLPIAGRLYDRFQQRWGKDKVFMDFDSIPYGVDFRDHLKQAIDGADVLVVLIGPKWQGNGGGQSRRIHDADDFVRFEVSYALQRNLPIIPILIGDTRMPRPEELPTDIRALAYRNAVYLDPAVDFHYHVDRIVNSIERASPRIAAADSSRAPHVRHVPEDPSEAAHSPRPSLRRRYVIIGALCLVNVIAATILVLHWQSNRSASTAAEQRESTPEPTTSTSPTAALSPSTPASIADPPAVKSAPSTVGPYAATGEKPFENSIGMRFVPLPSARVLFSVWETRVRDFRAYAAATNYRQSGGVMTLKLEFQNKSSVVTGATLDPNGSWERPGFTQTDFHPVVGVSWDEAKEFCAWLTKKERAEGLLTSQQEYRLPLDEEWSAASGKRRYPWGDEWPPSSDAGNYLDEASIRSFGNSGYAQIPGDDGYRHTAPAGRYTANAFGLYDLGGNVFEWCEDRYRSRMNPPEILKKNPTFQAEQNQILALRPVRGGSWLVGDADTARSDFRVPMPGLARINFVGFRCVLVLDNTASSPSSATILDVREEVTDNTPINSPTIEPKISASPAREGRFAGTWQGSAQSRTSEGSSSTSTYSIKFSEDEKTVWTNWDGPENGFKSSARRSGPSMTWSVRQHPGKTGFSAWKMDCSMTLRGRQSASFTAKTVYIGGQFKGITGKVEGTLSR